MQESAIYASPEAKRYAAGTYRYPDLLDFGQLANITQSKLTKGGRLTWRMSLAPLAIFYQRSCKICTGGQLSCFFN